MATIVEVDELGSLICGTLRNQDLLPAFYDVLEEHDVDTAEWDEFLDIPEDDEFWDSEEASWVVNEMIDALCDIAPEGFYFGAHPGDGSCFGFWAVTEDFPWIVFIPDVWEDSGLDDLVVEAAREEPVKLAEQIWPSPVAMLQDFVREVKPDDIVLAVALPETYEQAWEIMGEPQEFLEDKVSDYKLTTVYMAAKALGMETHVIYRAKDYTIDPFAQPDEKVVGLAIKRDGTRESLNNLLALIS